MGPLWEARYFRKIQEKRGLDAHSHSCGRRLRDDRRSRHRRGPSRPDRLQRSARVLHADHGHRALPGGHPAADFAVEFGAGITAPEIPGDENPFGAPVNTISLWPDLHECDPFEQGAPPCPWDTSGDGQVGIVDFLDLLGHWGDCP